MIKVAIIGLGNRGRTYGRHFFKNKNAKIVALCEKNTDFLDTYAKKWKVPRSACFCVDEDFFAEGRLADVLVIATQDRDHYRHAMAALALGYHLLLEKPVSPVLSETQEILDAANRGGLKVVVCHVLRYAKFYGKIKQIIQSGAIGEVKHVNHTENIGYWHFSHSYVRGNWRKESETSPSILAKCCHDFDMIYYLTGKKCLSVSSSGELSYFTAKNKPAGAPDYCMDGCPAAKNCPYEARKIYYGFTRHTVPYMIVNARLITGGSRPTLGKLKSALRRGQYGRCVFGCDNDVMENQAVNMSLEGGATATLCMTAFSKNCYRKIHIYGTKGEIFGNDTDGRFRLNIFGGLFRTIRTGAKVISLHGISDKNLVDEFVDFMEGKGKPQKLTLLSDTMESHRAAWFAEIARKSHKTESTK